MRRFSYTALAAASIAAGVPIATAENFIMGEKGIRLPDAMGLPVQREPRPSFKIDDFPGGEIRWSPWAGRFIIPFHTAPPRPHPRKAATPAPERAKRDLAEQK